MGAAGDPRRMCDRRWRNRALAAASNGLTVPIVRARRLTALVVALVAAALAPAAHAASGLTLGFNGDPVLTDTNAPSNSYWIGQAHAEGAGVVRIDVSWSDVAPAERPQGFVADNPASPGYEWSSVDSEVRALTAQGLQVLMNITYAPTWAEAPGRPKDARPGTWKPSATQFGKFAIAAARRYDGRFPDPSKPGMDLPHVEYWQAWDEPNLGYYLTPQWTKTRHGLAPTSPTVYRALLNAFYAGIKSVDRSNVVLTAGIAPYGNPPGVTFPGGLRMHPLIFDRLLFSRQTYCDVVAQNSYPLRGPQWHAFQPEDVSVADLYKVAAIVHSAERAGHVLPRGPKPLWLTELAWNSKPPNPGGVSTGQQARWYEQAFYELWRQGVSGVLLLQLVDSPPIPNYATAYETGLYYLSGQPKPAATAFRFPFVTSRSNPRTVVAWGRAPAAGTLVIERLSGGNWKPIVTLQAGFHEVFEKTFVLRSGATLRAQVAGQTSLPWSQAG